MAGLQPHLSCVRLIKPLGLHNCGAWAIMAPRINQLLPHTLRREQLDDELMMECYIFHNYLSYVGGPQQKWCGRETTATLAPNVGRLRPGKDMEGLPGHTLESPATFIDSHLPAPALSQWQWWPVEERGGSNCHRQPFAASRPPDPAWSSPGPAALLPASTAAQGSMLHKGDGDPAWLPWWRGGTYQGLFLAKAAAPRHWGRFRGG